MVIYCKMSKDLVNAQHSYSQYVQIFAGVVQHAEAFMTICRLRSNATYEFNRLEAESFFRATHSSYGSKQSCASDLTLGVTLNGMPITLEYELFLTKDISSVKYESYRLRVILPLKSELEDTTIYVFYPATFDCVKLYEFIVDKLSTDKLSTATDTIPITSSETNREDYKLLWIRSMLLKINKIYYNIISKLN